MAKANETRHHLVIMKPGKNGVKGTVLMEAHVFGETARSAINALRQETEAGTDLIIISHHDFVQSQLQQQNAVSVTEAA